MEDNEHPGYYLPNLESPIPPLLGRTSSRLEDEDIGLEMYFQPLDIEPDQLDVKPQECVTKYKDGTTFQVVSDLQKVINNNCNQSICNKVFFFLNFRLIIKKQKTVVCT